MATNLLKSFTLNRYDSQQLVQLGSRAAGTYEAKIGLNGNSVLVSLFIKSMDVGATVTVNYYDDVSGESRRLIGSHGLLSGETDFHSKLVVTEIHNKFITEVIITGGSVECMVMGTMVDNFPIDIKGILDGATANLANDTGLPSVLYNPDDGKFYLATGNASGATLVQEVALKDLGKTFVFANIGPTWTPLPLVAEGNQKSIGVQNQSEFQMKLSFDNTLGYDGWELESKDSKFYDISSTLVVYVRTETETNQTVIVEVVG